MKTRSGAAHHGSILLWMFALILASSSARAQLEAGVTLGVALSKFANQISEIVQQAIGGGNLLVIQAGGQISGAIQQAQAAYQSDLNLTYDKLSLAEKNALDQIAGVVNDFAADAAHTARDTAQTAQQIANTLPLSKTFPQLTRFGPNYAIAQSFSTDPDSVHLVLEGNFVDLYRSGFNAQAQVGSKSFTNSTKTTQQVAFDIPLAVLNPAPIRDHMIQNLVTIRIPYQDAAVLGPGVQKTATFLVPLTLLPNILGEGTVSLTKTVPGVETQVFTTNEMHQESVDDDIKCGGEHADLAVHSVPADPGWVIIPSSVKMIVTWSQGKEGEDGDWWLSNNCSTQQTACVCISTEHHRFGTSGKVHFKLQYTAQRASTQQKSGTMTLSLPWRKHDVLDMGDNHWSISFKRFDGRDFGIAAPYSDEFLRVRTSGQYVTIMTYPFE